MPFTYSISVGIGAGFIAYVLIKIVRGKMAGIHPLMWIVAILFLVFFLQGWYLSIVNPAPPAA
jgi:AGZA family xanthine/uracil permease-like MFS transporter